MAQSTALKITREELRDNAYLQAGNLTDLNDIVTALCCLQDLRVLYGGNGDIDRRELTILKRGAYLIDAYDERLTYAQRLRARIANHYLATPHASPSGVAVLHPDFVNAYRAHLTASGRIESMYIHRHPVGAKSLQR